MKLSELSTPVLLLDWKQAQKNLENVLERAKELGIAVRPHYKSYRAPRIGKYLVEQGCKGLCCATIGEAEDCAEAGIENVLITNVLVSMSKLKRAAAIAGKCRLTVCVDAVQNILDYEKAAAEAGTEIYVFVECNVGQNRCGVNTKEEVLELAQLIEQQPHLHFDGIQAYAGQLSHEPDEEKSIEAGISAETKVKEIKALLEDNGIKVNEISGLSSSSFTLRRKMGGTAYTEAQCGSFLYVGNEFQPVKYFPFDNALYLLGTVISVKPDSFVTDCGLKTVSVDNGNPVLKDYPELASGMSEENITHFMKAQPYHPGDQVIYLPAHACTTVNLHRKMYLVDGDEVLEEVEITSHGKSQ